MKDNLMGYQSYCQFYFRLEVVEKADNAVTIKSGDNKVVLMGAPFRIDLYSGNNLVISGNARGLLRFEHQQVKLEP